MKKLLHLAFLFSLLPFIGLGQGIYPSKISTNGQVNTIAQDGGTLYLGGSFTQAGYYTGRGALLSATSDIPDTDFPATNGTIHAAVSDGAGGWYIGGSFTLVGTVQRQYLAHVLADKTVDPSWNPGANSTVLSLALGGGMLYAGGSFTQVGGQERKYLAAFSASDGALTGWNPSANSQVNTISVSGGTVYAGGSFSEIGGKAQRYFAAIDAVSGAVKKGLSVNSTVQTIAQDGGTLYLGGSFTQAGYYTGRGALLSASSDIPDTDFPATNGSINAAISDGAGGWFIGGSFTQVGTVQINYLAHILADKTVDPNWNPGANSTVLSLALGGNTLYVGGYFTEVAGQSRSYLAALDKGDGSLTGWNPLANSIVNTLAVSGSTVYVGGQFTEIAGQQRRYLASVSVTDGAVSGWNPQPNSYVNTIMPDGSLIYVGGSFSNINATTRLYMAAFEATSLQLTPFNPQPNSTVETMAVSSDRVYFGGSFSWVGQQPQGYLAALNKSDGSLLAWDPRLNGTVKNISLSSGVLYAGGNFTQVGDQDRRYLAAFNTADNSLTGWAPQPNSYVDAIAVSGGGILVGGSFAYLKSESRQYILSYDAATNQVSSFNPRPNSTVEAIALGGSNVYFGGSFSYAGSQQQNYLAAASKADGSLLSWNPQLNNAARSLAYSDGVLYAGGYFTQASGQERKHLAAFSTIDNSLTAWAPQPNSYVDAIAMSGTGILVGGSFDYLKSESRQYMLSFDALTNQLSTFNPMPNSWVNSIAIGGSNVYFGGSFYSVGGQQRNYVAAASKADGSLTDWNPQLNSYPNTLAVSEGALYIGGQFTTVDNQERRYLASFNLLDGSLNTWNPKPDAVVNILKPTTSSVFVGGGFSYFDKKDRRGLLAIDVSTGKLTDWNPQLNTFTFTQVNTILASGDVIYIGGNFSSMGGQQRSNIAALDKSSGLATAWNPSSNSTVSQLLKDNQIIYVRGFFTTIGGQSRRYIAALSTETGAATDWNPNPLLSTTPSVSSIALDQDRLYVGGRFANIGGQTRNNLAAFNRTDGTLTAWNPNANNAVTTVTPDTNAVYVTGSFTAVGGQLRSGLAALNKVDGTSTAWNPGLSGTVFTTLLYSKNILFGGRISSAAGIPVGNLALISKETAKAIEWYPKFNSDVLTTLLAGDTIYTGGSFTTVDTKARNYLASFNSPPDAATKIDQTITFENLTDKVYGTAAFQLNATASSGLPVTYTILEGPATINGSNYLSINGVGTIRVKASQAGNVSYNPAPDVERSFCALPAVPSVISGNADVCVGLQNYSVTNVTGATFFWSVSGGGTVTQNGNTASIEWTTAGTHTIKVSYTGNCGSVGPERTLTVSVTDTPLTDTVSNMLPADGNSNLSLPLTFSWQPVANAASYDLYVWLDGTVRPTTPKASNLTQINYTFYSGLEYEKLYKWQIVAKKACYQLESQVQTFKLRYLPDLVASNVQVPASGFSGQPFTVSWEVSNQGQGSTVNQQWYDAVYLSIDAVFDQGDTYLGAAPNPSFLEVSKSYSQTATFNLPEGIANNYYVFVVANAFGSLLELERSNNTNISNTTSTIQLTPPADLQVTSIIRPSNTFSGQSISLTWTVKNEGTGSTRATSWSDLVYLSQEPTFNAASSVILGGFSHISALNAGESYTQTQSVKLPEGISGTYYIYIRTDASNQVYEHAFESNNTTRSDEMNVLLTPPIDLVVTQIVNPAKASNGETVQVNWTVENQGGSSTDGKSWIDRLYLTQDESLNIKTATLVGQAYRFAAIEPGENYTGQLNIVIPDKINGNYYLFVTTDADNKLFEYTNEDNNTTRSTTALTVVSPDLIVSSVVVPAADTSGDSISVRWTVKNNGEGDIYNSKLTDRILISSNATYNPNAVTEIKRLTYDTSNLTMGDEISKETQAKLPNGFSGTYYVYVLTDYLNTVYESIGENNNVTGSSAIQVVLGPWPDLQVSDVQTKTMATAGDAISLSFRVWNKGQITTKESFWTDGVYISESNTWDPGKATFIRSISRSQVLTKDSSYLVNTTLRLPSNIGGTNYYLYVFADGEQVVYEHTDEGNNIVRSEAFYVEKYPPVDLAVTAISAPSAGTTGTAIQLQWTIQNQGQAVTLPGFWYDGLYLSEDKQWDKDKDVFVGEWKQPGPLEAGKDYTTQKNFTLPNGAAGNYYLLLVTDHTDMNKDADRSNNYKLITDSNNNPATIDVKLTPPADLIVSSFTAPAESTAGQPITLTWTTQNTGTGPTAAGAWTDKVYLSKDMVIDGTDLAIGTFARSGVLEPGANYTTSLQAILPSEASGNYVLICKTDFTNAVYEHQAEGNNIRTASINVVQPPLSDLVVSSVIIPSSAIAGNAVNVQWKVKNVGANPAAGTMQEAVYLSLDTIRDVNDVLLGTRTSTIALPAQQEATHELTAELKDVSIKDYYVLVHTDVKNNVLESNDNNNLRPSDQVLRVTVPDLHINVLTQATLVNEKALFYKLEVPDNLVGETLLITLKGDSINGANEIYLRHSEAPNRVLYDYSHSEAYQGNQEIIVPELKQGTYYLMVYGKTAVNQQQPVSLLATILQFGIRTVHAKTGGNTGPVTVQINGSKLADVSNIRLSNSGATFEAENLKIVDPTRVFATFNLKGAALGDYDVIAQNAKGEVTDQKNGFKVVSGTASNLVTNVVAPPSTRPSNVISLTVQFTNAGNTDIINPVLELSSLAGAPIGFTVTELGQNMKLLALQLQELNGPAGILRPGATGTIIIYSKATSALTFTLLLPHIIN